MFFNQIIETCNKLHFEWKVHTGVEIIKERCGDIDGNQRVIGMDEFR